MEKHTQFLKLGTRQKELNPEEIICFEADVNYTTIHFKSGKTNTIAFTLKSIESQLLNHQVFCRVHKKFIVNLNYISRVEESEITLKNEKKILLSRRRKKQNLERLKHKNLLSFF